MPIGARAAFAGELEGSILRNWIRCGAVIGTEHRRAARIRNTPDSIGLSCFEDVQRPDQIDLGAKNGIVLASRGQQGREVNDRRTITRRLVQGISIGDVALEPLGAIRLLAGDLPQNTAVGRAVDDADRMALRGQ